MPGPRVFSGQTDDAGGGTKWHYLSDPPASNIGKMGDFYLKSTDNSLFYKANATDWNGIGIIPQQASTSTVVKNYDPTTEIYPAGTTWLNTVNGFLWITWFGTGTWAQIAYTATRPSGSGFRLGGQNQSSDVFGMGNQEALFIGEECYLKTGHRGQMMGYRTGRSGTTTVPGTGNVVFGMECLVGFGTDSNTSYNSIFGNNAGCQTGKGQYNIAIGQSCMGSNMFVSAANSLSIFGGWNIGIGDTALNSIKGDAFGNIGIGREAGKSIGNSYQNTCVGYQAGYSHIGSVISSYNTYIGSGAGYSNTNGQFNTALGLQAFGTSSSIGNYNTCLGALAGKQVADNNVVIGYNAASNLGTVTQNNNLIGPNVLRNHNNLSQVYSSNIMASQESNLGSFQGILSSSNVIGIRIPRATTLNSSNLFGNANFSTANILNAIDNTNVFGNGNLISPANATVQYANVFGSTNFSNSGSVAVANVNVHGYRIGENATSVTSFTAIGNQICNGANSLSLAQSEIMGTNAGNMNGNISNSVYIGTNCYHSTVSACANNICIGYSARTNGDNQIVLGSNTHTTFRVPRFTAAGTLSTDASGNITSASDERMKTEIQPIANALEIIAACRGITHKWKEETGLDTVMRYGGCVAQDWAKFFPDCVAQETNTGNYSLNYNLVVGTLVEAVKSLYNRVKALETA